MVRPRLPLVLLGPMAAGKTTLSRAVSEALDLPYAPLDWVGFHTMVLDGLDVRAYEAADVWADRLALMEPHLIAVAESAVRHFRDFVLDFGAGHAHFETEGEIARLEAVLGPLPNVFLVLPCLDVHAAEAICQERDQARWREAGQTWDASRAPYHRAFVRSASFRRVAKHTILTEGRSVDECVDEITSLLQ